jgi:hypothetical protein
MPVFSAFPVRKSSVRPIKHRPAGDFSLSFAVLSSGVSMKYRFNSLITIKKFAEKDIPLGAIVGAAD